MARSSSTPSLPLYVSVDRSIRETIARGEWRPGTQLPPLPALAERFGCGISTMRRVVETLTDENVLIAQQGKGIFVKSYLKHGYWNRFHRFQRIDGSLIERYEDTLERFEVVRAGAAIAHELGIGPEDWVVHWQRRMDVEGEPCGSDEAWLPRARFPTLAPEDFLKREPDVSVYAIYERAGILVGSVSERITAGIADPAAEPCGGIDAGKPLFRLLRTTFDVCRRRVEFRIERVDATRTQIVLS